MRTKFTPWRMRYIKRADASAGCVFCAMRDAAGQGRDAELLVLSRHRSCFTVLNLFPYNTAHLMVVPLRHGGDLTALPADQAAELFAVGRAALHALTAEYGPHGFNLGMNLGASAGAGIAEHLHLHVVPRWNGDTNFLPIVAETKLIPETLAETYRRLQPHFATLSADQPLS
jgi:ATP adenylyltransferase